MSATIRWILRFTLFALLVSRASAWAAAGCNEIITHNQTPKWVWVTIYDATKLRHLDYGWMAPFGTRDWRSGQYVCDAFYHVRGEVKASEDPVNPPGDTGNIGDTIMQVNFGASHDYYIKTPITTMLIGADASQWAYDPTRFWWDMQPAVPAGTVAVPRISWNLENDGPVTAVFASTGLRGQRIAQCLAPGGKALLTVPKKDPRPLSITAKTGDCNSPDLGTPMTVSPMLATSMQYFTTDLKTVQGAYGPSVLFYANNSPVPVEFSSSAGTRCVAPMKIVSVEAKPGSYRVGMRIMRDCVSGPAIGRATTGDVTVPATGSSQIQFGLQLVQGN